VNNVSLFGTAPFGEIDFSTGDNAPGITEAQLRTLATGGTVTDIENADFNNALDQINNYVGAVGNVEARDFFVGVADVVVCDGFVGNVTMKFGQGLALAIRNIVKDELRGLRGKLLRLYLAPLVGSILRLYRRIDYREYGGAPLLGIDGVVIVAHGSSNARALRNAVRVATETVSHGFVEELRSRMPQAHDVTLERTP